MNKTALLSAAGALAGAVAMVQAASPAQAESVRCYGISLAGQNDCANQAAGHACAGQSTIDYDGMDFKAVGSEQTCIEQAGKLEPFQGQNPQKS